jgi:hypothetical protein
MPASRAIGISSSNTSSERAILLFVFFWLCVSLADKKIATSFKPTARARSRPVALGQSAL